jgi:hypothetical protein
MEDDPQGPGNTPDNDAIEVLIDPAMPAESDLPAVREGDSSPSGKLRQGSDRRTGTPRGALKTGCLLAALPVAGTYATTVFSEGGSWSLRLGALLDPTIALFTILYPAGLLAPFGVPFEGAVIIGCALYVAFILTGIAVRCRPWFRYFLVGYSLLVILNFAGCHWTASNSPDLHRAFGTSKPQNRYRMPASKPAAP